MKTTWCNEEYDCEVVALGMDDPKDEAATPLALTRADGKSHYLVVVKKQEDIGKKVLTQPSDGNVVAMCVSEVDAKLVAASINIARLVSDMHDGLKTTTDQKMRDLGFDVDRMNAEIDRLKKEGKSCGEIFDYMKSRKAEFLMAGKTLPKEKGEW